MGGKGRCGRSVHPSAASGLAGEAEAAEHGDLLRELQGRRLGLLWQPGGDLYAGFQDLCRQAGGLQIYAGLGRQPIIRLEVWRLGRGQVRAGVHGQAWRLEAAALRADVRRHMPVGPARGPEEEQEVRTTLLELLGAGHTSAEVREGVGRVLGHYSEGDSGDRVSRTLVSESVEHLQSWQPGTGRRARREWVLSVVACDIVEWSKPV